MYTKQILGGWDLTESDFNSRQEWLTHCERSTKEYHEKEAARLAALDEKKSIESEVLREKVLKFLVALESGEKITFSNAMQHNGKLRVVNPKIGDIPLIWELFSVSGLSFCTKSYSEQDAQIIVDAFVNALAQAANVSNAKSVEVRDVSKYAKAFDIIF